MDDRIHKKIDKALKATYYPDGGATEVSAKRSGDVYEV
jgi:hypothetical protein